MDNKLVSMTNRGTCKKCNVEKTKIVKKVYVDNSYYCVDENNKAWHGSVCPSCYVAQRKISRKQHDPQEVSCVECGTKFMSKSKRNKFCSAKCKIKNFNDKREFKPRRLVTSDDL